VPADDFVRPEPSIRGPVPDVLALHLSAGSGGPSGATPGLAMAAVPPRARIVRRSERALDARKANRVAVRHRHGDIVAVIEIVSPGNKGSLSDVHAFVEEGATPIRQGVHLLVIDLFPPTKRDPQGLHEAIWGQFEEEEDTPPADQPLLVAAYDAGPPRVAYVEPVAVGAVLPEMPLFLKPEFYVLAPLEASYQTTWDLFPAPLKGLLEPPAADPA
jgi:hypothetical protein